jgi:hypothetical protein
MFLHVLHLLLSVQSVETVRGDSEKVAYIEKLESQLLEVKYENSYVQPVIERLRTDMGEMSVHARNHELEMLRAEDNSHERQNEVQRLVVALQQKDEELQRECAALIDAKDHIMLKDRAFSEAQSQVELE